MQLPQNQKIFSQFLSAFQRSTSNLDYFEPEDEPQRLKVGLLKCLKRPVSEHFWTVNMLKGRKHCLNLHRRNFVRFSHHSERKSVQKNSVLLVSKILRLFVNIFTPGDKYSLSVKTSV